MRTTFICIVLGLLVFSCQKKESDDGRSAPAAAEDGGADGADGGGTDSGDAGGNTDGGGTGSVPVGTLHVGNVSAPADVSALRMNTTVNAVTPQDVESLPVGTLGLGTTNLAPVVADFDGTPTYTFTNDDTRTLMSNVNFILCLLGQTEYNKFIGQGAYLAAVDHSGCYDRTQGTQPAKRSSEDPPPAMSFMTLNVTRAAADKPIQVAFWIDYDALPRQKNNFDWVRINGTAWVGRGANRSNPYGIMRVAWEKHDLDNTNKDVLFLFHKAMVDTSELEDGSAVLVNYIESDDLGQGQRISAKLNYDPGSGKIASGHFASAWGNDSDIGTASKDLFAYSDSHLRRKYSWDTNHQCFDRKNIKKKIWRYGLFHKDTGKLLDDSQYGAVVSTQVSGNTEYGWADQMGVYFDNLAAYVDGATVKVTDPTDLDSPGIDHTLEHRDGALWKNEKVVLSGATLEQYEFEFTEIPSTDKYLLKYNDGDGLWYKIGIENPSPLHFDDLYSLITPEVYTLTHTKINGISQPFIHNAREGMPTIAQFISSVGSGVLDEVYIVKKTKVSGTLGSNLDFKCARLCPKENIAVTDLRSPLSWDRPDAGTALAMYDYRYNASTYRLEYDTGGATWVPVVYTFDETDLDGTEIVTWTSPDWQFQMWDTTTWTSLNGDSNYYADMAVAPQQTSYFYRQALTFKHWWYSGLRNGGSLKTFAAPLWTKYQHTQGNDLDGGAGHDSYGRPFWFKIERSTGTLSDIFGYPVDDYDSDTIYEPWFQPKSGTLWGDYKFKILELEEVMPEVADSNCTSIKMESDLGFTMDKDRVDGNPGAKPTVTGTVKVVGGRIVE